MTTELIVQRFGYKIDDTALDTQIAKAISNHKREPDEILFSTALNRCSEISGHYAALLVWR